MTIATPRTLDELKAETQDRANRQAHPCAGVTGEEAREALANLKSLDPDDWAAVWSALGDRHAERAEAARDPAAAAQGWRHAVDLYLFARFPFDSSPGKAAAQTKMLAAFAKLGALQDPPIERVAIPFDGKTVAAYLRLPKGAGPWPVVITVGGLDSRKEHAALRNAAYLDHGIASLAFDMPGTGESRVVPAAPGAEGLFSSALDFIATRRALDASRVAIYGSSWGGHWAARLGFSERQRLRGAVVQGGPVHGYFQPGWQRTALGNREYLFGLFEARAAVYGVSTLDDFLAYGPQLSLKDAGWLDRPSAPMLVINGAKDTQVPFEDVVLLLSHGSPKEAWVNPEGGHMGRIRTLPDPVIFDTVTLPWIVRRLTGD
jgi:pimeloyl-ACP methyl ester carboxylesterase